MRVNKFTTGQRAPIQIQLAEEILILMAEAIEFGKVWLWKQSTHKTHTSAPGKPQPYHSLDTGSWRCRDGNAVQDPVCRGRSSVPPASYTSQAPSD